MKQAKHKHAHIFEARKSKIASAAKRRESGAFVLHKMRYAADA